MTSILSYTSTDFSHFLITLISKTNWLDLFLVLIFLNILIYITF